MFGPPLPDDGLDAARADLLQSLLEDERVFDSAIAFLRRLCMEAEQDGNTKLAHAFKRLANAFQRFDYERTTAVVDIITSMEEVDE